MARIVVGASAVLALSAALWAQQSPGQSPAAAPTMHAGGDDTDAPSQMDKPRDPVDELLDEMRYLLDEVQDLRMQLAQANLKRAESERELAELQQFIEDHDQLGDAYKQYRAVKAAAEQESQRKELESRRAEYERIKAERKARYQEARAQRQAEQADQQRLSGYDRAGFGAIGLDVYVSRMSFFYSTKDSTPKRIDYQPGFGHYLRLYPGQEIDFTNMTISGSLINAADETRNIGIAVVFFDEAGTQVGHEIVQVANARPDVPYPFTSTVQMALNRPFASSSQYVLYADPIVPGGDAPQPQPQQSADQQPAPGKKSY